MASTVKICVIVGNGFDLAAGLDTSSSAFVRSFELAHRGEDTPAGRLAAKMADQGLDEWSDFELALGKYAGDLGLTLSEDDLEREYLEAKEAVEDSLIAFVSEQEQSIDEDYIDACSSACVSSLCDWFASLTQRDREKVKAALGLPADVIFSFVTFNYTSVIDLVVGLMRSNNYRASQAMGVSSFLLEKPVHAHGKLGDNPICGVNDESQVASEQLRSSAPVLDTVVKRKTQELFGDMSDAVAFRVIAHADVVLIFGCSMGLTDKRWWEAVIDWLKDSPTRFVIIAAYGLEQHQRTAHSFRCFTLGLREKLFEGAGRADQEGKENLYERILIIPSSKIFKFSEPSSH